MNKNRIKEHVGDVGMIKYKSRDYNCPLEFAYDITGGRWKPRIMWFLGDQTRRSGELERMMPDTSRKVLIQQLRELEQDGIVCRHVFAQVPPKVEYSLTDRGKELLPILSNLREWGIEHINHMKDKPVEMQDDVSEE